MENRTLSYSGDPLVRAFLCQHYVSLFIISVCMSFFPFSFRLAECRYKGELALISCKIYSIISDPTKTDQCVQDNICRLQIRLGLKISRVFKYFLLIKVYSVQLNIKCFHIVTAILQ